MELESIEIPVEKLLLDPNNYRFQEDEDFTYCPADKSHLENVQKNAYTKLRAYGLKELKDSITSNGFLPVERIIVEPYTPSQGYFRVIEGNRRVAALKWIELENNSSGIKAPDKVIGTLDAVPCLVVKGNGESSYFREALMGIRHVGGIKQWGGYQRAKLIAALRDEHELEPPEIGARLGLTVNEVNRRYRAYKALQQMENDEEFGDYARPNMYPLFHEAVALPVLRDWLGWNRDTGQFDNDDTREQFYRLITPYEDEHTNQIKPPKLTTFSDIRELKYIIPNVEARQYLMDVDSSFFDARSVARKSELSKKWRYEVGQAISAMKSISAFEIPNLTGDDIAELGKVVEVAQTLITHYNVIKKSVE